MALLRIDGRYNANDSLPGPISDADHDVLSEARFLRMLAIERKRTERSKAPFLLMILEAGSHPPSARGANTLDRVISALVPATRDTDIVGWYKDGSAIGVLFTELSSEDKSTTVSTILDRVTTAMRQELSFDQFSQISISFHFFPDDWNERFNGPSGDPALYSDLRVPEDRKRVMLGVKRFMDIVLSALMLLVCSPFLLAIAIAVKATSRGPVLFRQHRVGQHGRQFVFLKFRSMQMNNDQSVHSQYVTRLIAGSAERVSTNDSGPGVYKLANDKRVTSVGKFLRRTSLDELPQFLNVLRGDMSLVGPRPPIPYELAVYQTWHRSRLLQVKPGITGLWQVTGRSRVTFDEMVRLDLQYAARWSPWLDLKILLQTPAAVFKGAY